LKSAGTLADLVSLARRGEVDYVYIALPTREDERILQLINDLADTTASVFVVPDLFIFQLNQARWTDFGGLPIVSIYESPFEGMNGTLKRIEDVVLSSLILLVVALPMLVIAAIIKFTSKGSVLFKQRRYGLNGKVVEVWKFRSMSVSDNGVTVTQAQRSDPRVTPFGAFLRRTSLDELPQFINVLLGDMSVVGPRPHAVAHNEQYRGLIPGYMLRHKVKPGITGWAQINGWRGETDTLDKMQRRVECDLEYMRNWSLWFDLKIVALTVVKGFTSKNAY
jgi:putative colanic acid biosynthesis UDP-glucose lipid carrier transferase